MKKLIFLLLSLALATTANAASWKDKSGITEITTPTGTEFSPAQKVTGETATDHWFSWSTLKTWVLGGAINLFVDGTTIEQTGTEPNITIGVKSGVFALAGSGGAPTEVATLPDPLVDGTVYAARDTGDLTYKSATGTYTIAGNYTADVVTYSMALTISGVSGADKITVGATDYTSSATITGLSSSTTALTGVPDTGRAVTCTGTSVTGTTPDYTVDMSDSNESVSCTFSAAENSPDFYYAMTTKTTTPDIGSTMTTNTGTVLDANGQSGNCLVYTAGAGDKFINIGLLNIDNTIGTIDFYYRPDYSGSPATTQFPFFASTTFQIANNTDGSVVFTYGAKYSSIIGWSPTSGTWYHIVAKYSATAGTYSLQIDSGTPASASGSITAPTISSANFGRQYKTDQTFAIDEVKIWKSLE